MAATPKKLVFSIAGGITPQIPLSYLLSLAMGPTVFLFLLPVGAISGLISGFLNRHYR